MAEAFAILRTAKLKTPGNVAASASHIERTRPTSNADAERTHLNRWLVGGPGMYASAKTVWDKVPKKRSDAVHAFEVLMSASPEAMQAPDFDLDKWAAQSSAWMAKQFKGAVIVGACLHMDEATPHIQAIIVPTALKPDGTLQLNCKKYLGSAAKLSAMQTSYAKAVENLGLERGIQGSKAKHTRIGQFYQAVNARPARMDRPVVATPPMILTEKGRKAWAAAQTATVVEGLSPSLVKLQHQARSVAMLQRQAEQLKRSNSVLTTDYAEYRRKQKEQADQLRLTPLDQVATALGCYQDAKTLAKDKDRWQSAAGPLNIKGSKFFNHETGEGGGGAFDLVMHVNECSYTEALAWLRDSFDPAAAINAVAESARIRAQADVEKAAPAPFRVPQHIEKHWPRVKNYLTVIRGLAVGMVDKLREAGWLGADAKANAYFLKADANNTVAVELKGTGKSTYSGSRGRSSEGVFEVLGGKRKLVVCEAPIDALSYVQLHPDCSAIATGGTGKWRAAMPFLIEHQDEYGSLACASDNDQAGREMAANYGIDHEPPPNGFHDWNDALLAFNVDPKALGSSQEARTGVLADPEPEAHERPLKALSRRPADDPSLG